MNNSCESTIKNTSLSLEIDKAAPTRVHVVFVNRHETTLWFPKEPMPSYQIKDQAYLVTVFYGYIEEQYERYYEQYILPPMQAVSANQEYKLEIKDRDLVRAILAPKFHTKLLARIALRNFVKNDVRGEQELDAYIRESCVIKSLSGSVAA